MRKDLIYYLREAIESKIGVDYNDECSTFFEPYPDTKDDPFEEDLNPQVVFGRDTITAVIEWELGDVYIDGLTPDEIQYLKEQSGKPLPKITLELNRQQVSQLGLLANMQMKRWQERAFLNGLKDPGDLDLELYRLYRNIMGKCLRGEEPFGDIIFPDIKGPSHRKYTLTVKGGELI